MNEQEKYIPPFVICPNCVIKLELDESEMASRQFVCPRCQDAFDINKDKFKKYIDKAEDTPKWRRLISYSGSIGRMKFVLSYLIINLFLIINLVFMELGFQYHTGMEFGYVTISQLNLYKIIKGVQS